jgi:hypothetical protein
MAAAHNIAHIHFVEASIARMQKALEGAEGPHKALLELFIKEAWRILEERKPHARH